MIVDLFLLKRLLRRRRMPMRAFFRTAKLSRVERACILHGVAVSSYAVARMCAVLDCPQSALKRPSASEQRESVSLVEG